MNIRDFLIDNYIWILVVILLTIITIIGFLADKKKGSKELKNVNAGGNTTNNVPPINYQNIPNQAPVNYQQNGMNNSMGQGFNIPTPVNAQPINYQMNQPQPMEMNSYQNVEVGNVNNMAGNMVGSVENANFEGMLNQGMMPNVDMNNMNSMNNMGNMGNMNGASVNVIPGVEQGINVVPQTLDNVNNNMPQAEPMYQPLSEQKPNIMPQEVPGYPSAVNMNNPMVDSGMVMGNEMNNAPIMNNMGMMPNVSQPINGPVPPVNPVPIPSGQATMPTPVSNMDTTNNNNNQPINFVYGPQGNNNNNNQFM